MSLVLAAALLASQGGVDVIVVILKVITFLIAAIALMLGSRDPKTRLPVVEGLVLTRKVMTLALALTGGVTTALREGAGALRQLGGYRGVLGDPVGEGIFAILNDAVLR
jgi:hydrogenase-4 membrane subunit HyfE